MKDLLTIGEYEPDQLQGFIDISESLQNSPQLLLAQKNILFVFEKPSLRTKVGTEAAITHLGGNVMHADPRTVFEYEEDPFGCRESLTDTVKNISQWCDAIFSRVYNHETLKVMADNADIPVINALCNLHHPMQALADLYTIQQEFGRDEKVSVTFVGDANNVAFSLIEIGLKFGHDMRFSGPADYYWSDEKIQYFKLLEVEYGGSFHHTTDPFEAVKGSNVIYTDAFVSMGEEDILEEKLLHFKDYQVNRKLMKMAGSSAKFMHCLPAHRGIEVTDEVIDDSGSLVLDQSKNRMVISKGVFASLINKPAVAELELYQYNGI
jgi:ornithine carbamoyltransferase